MPLILLLAFGLAGCETQSASAPVKIEPSTATITEGESVEFTASGGYEYTWSIENPTWGILSSTRGSTITYRSLISTVSNTEAKVQTLTVTSYIPGDSSGGGSSGTNMTPSTVSTVSAQALVYHVATTE